MAGTVIDEGARDPRRLTNTRGQLLALTGELDADRDHYVLGSCGADMGIIIVFLAQLRDAYLASRFTVVRIRCCQRLYMLQLSLWVKKRLFHNIPCLVQRVFLLRVAIRATNRLSTV